MKFVSELPSLKLALYLSQLHSREHLSTTYQHTGPSSTEAQQPLCSFCPAVISSAWLYPVLSRFGCPFLAPPSIPLPSSVFFLLTDKEVGLASTEEPRQSRKRLPSWETLLSWQLWMVVCAVRVHSLTSRSLGPISPGLCRAMY